MNREFQIESIARFQLRVMALKNAVRKETLSMNYWKLFKLIIDFFFWGVGVSFWSFLFFGAGMFMFTGN
jgi:hypothetical protein